MDETGLKRNNKKTKFIKSYKVQTGSRELLSAWNKKFVSCVRIPVRFYSFSAYRYHVTVLSAVWSNDQELNCLHHRVFFFLVRWVSR